jgi:hypothetical protein
VRGETGEKRTDRVTSESLSSKQAVEVEDEDGA